MNMRTLTIVFASLLVAALGATPARAATTTHLVRSGSAAHMHVSSVSDDGCVETSMSMDAISAVTRPDGTTSAELDLFLLRIDVCQGIFEFAFPFLPLTNEFQTSNGGQNASLNITVPIETRAFDGISRTRVLSANVQLGSIGQSFSGASSTRFNFFGERIVMSGHSVSATAEVTGGQISLDGQPLLPDAASSIETFMQVTVDITH
jgi:hypothetical protein